MGLRKAIAFGLLLCGTGLIGAGVVTSLEGPLSPVRQAAPAAAVAKAGAGTRPVDSAAAETAWRSWMERHQVSSASLAIGRDGAILHSAGVKRSPQTAYPLASLSKAVTGLCLNQLLEGSPYGWHSSLADLAPEFAKVNFTPAPQMATLTLTQIATHTSGLPEQLTYGSLSTRSVNLSSQPTMAKAALREPENFGLRGSYVYSNANYAILGFLIEALSGRPYGEICKARITLPAGAEQAAVAGRMSHAAGYGGWAASVEDYARIAMHWFAPDRPWMQAPDGFAYDRAVRYGMGVHVFDTAAGVSVSHSGRWTHKDPHKPNIGALFFVRPDGLVVVASWDRSLPWEAYDELYALLQNAV